MMTTHRFSRIEKLVMVVTTGRSGSLFVTNLVNQNAVNASSEHEPDVVPPNVSAQWFYDGDRHNIHGLVERKLARLRRGELLASLPARQRHLVHHTVARSRAKRFVPQVPIEPVYVEVNNAFLKSFGPVLLRKVPDVEIIHLTRDPLEQAKSAVNRGTEPHPSTPYYLWPTWDGNELRLDERIVGRLTRFQLALWYWFEMELRYVAMCRRDWVGSTYEIDLKALSDPDAVHEMFAAHGIEHRSISTRVDRHLGPRRSAVGDEERAQARSFLEHVPHNAFDLLPNTYGIDLL